MNSSNAPLKDTSSNVSTYLPPHLRSQQQNGGEAQPQLTSNAGITIKVSNNNNNNNNSSRPPRENNGDRNNDSRRNQNNNSRDRENTGPGFRGKPRDDRNSDFRTNVSSDSRPPRDNNSSYGNAKPNKFSSKRSQEREAREKETEQPTLQPELSARFNPQPQVTDNNNNSTTETAAQPTEQSRPSKFLSKGAQGGYDNNSSSGGGRDNNRSGNNNSYSRFGSKRGRRHEFNGEESNPAVELELFGEIRTGIDFTTYDSISSSATAPTGVVIPKTISSFDEISFGAGVESNLKLCGYERPTPIQKYSLPIAMNGMDMIACAQTGSGKTAAFLLPIVYRLLNQDILAYASVGNRSVPSPQAVIIGPTRELVTQIYKEACKFTYRTTIKPVVVYGGIHISEQIKQLHGGCHLLVATPGRLHDLCERKYLSLAHAQTLVFDEADRMLDMGFLPQIEGLLKDFDMPGRGDRQTLMFSATFPHEIQRLAASYLNQYIYVTIGRVGSSTSLVTQKLCQAPSHEGSKREALLGLLNECNGLTLVFVETKRSADILEQYLVDNDIGAASIHGDRTQREREEALAFFKTGHCPVLVATDVAARGLSIPNVEYVINYDMPNNIDDYVHRIGRTGRCGATGIATSFISERNKGIAQELLDNMKEAKQHIPEFLLALVDSSYRGFGGGARRGGGGYKPAPARNQNNDVRSFGSSSVTNNNSSGNNSSAQSFAPAPTPKKTAQPQPKIIDTSALNRSTNNQSAALSAVDAQDDGWW